MNEIKQVFIFHQNIYVIENFQNKAINKMNYQSPLFYQIDLLNREERRQMIIEETNNTPCCPLSFCGSLEHTTIQDCYHPDKFLFVEPIHNRILQDIHNKIAVSNETDAEETIMATVLNEIQQDYFREPMDEEQLNILLFRLKVRTVRYWNTTYDERIRLVLEEYRKIIRRYMAPVMNGNNVFMNEYLPDSESHELPPEEDLLDLDRAFENYLPILSDDEDLELLNEQNFNEGMTVIRISYKGKPDEVLNQEECPICYETGCYIKVVHCSHVFCDCLITYIMKKNEIRETVCCPCCRQKITELGFYDSNNDCHYELI